MKAITEKILENLSLFPRRGQPAVLIDITPTDSIIKYKEDDNETRNNDGLNLLKYLKEDQKGVYYLPEEEAEVLQESLTDFNVEAYLVGEKEVLEYIKNKIPNIYRYYEKLFKTYLITYEGPYPGILYPRDKIIKKYSEKVDRELIETISKEQKVYTSMIATDSVFEKNGQLEFPMETLLEIEKMERAQGYNFNTTLLKKSIGLNYFADYQLHLLQQWGDYSDFFTIGGRRIGKTYLQIYIALRELMIPNSTIIYAAPDMGMLDQPFLYLERFTKKIEDFARKVCEENGIKKFDNDLVLKRSDYSLRNTANGSIIWFLSGERRHGIRSQEAHLAIIDEAAFMKREEYINISVMVGQNRRQGRGKMFCITTINPKTPKNWFYDEYMQGVLGEEGYYSMKIPMTQSPFWTQKEIDKIILKTKGDETRIKTEVFAEFPDSNTRLNEGDFFYSDEQSKTNERIIFSGKNFFINKTNINKGSTIIIGYDPAKKVSQIGLIILNVYGEKKIEVAGEGDLPRGTGYVQQIEYFFAIYNYLKPLVKDIRLSIDENGIGATIYEMISTNHNVKILPVHTISNSNTLSASRGYISNYNFKNGIYYVKFDYLQELPVRLMETGKLKSYKFANILRDITALNNINEGDERKLQNKVDYWNALCIGVFAGTILIPEIITNKKTKKEQVVDTMDFIKNIFNRKETKTEPKNKFIY